MKKYFVILWPLFAVIAFASCKTISGFDQYAYQQATSLKVDAMNLMDKATSPYNRQLQEINEVAVRMEKLQEYEKHRPKNDITTKMWSIINNPDGHLFGGFLKRWKAKDSLNTDFIEEVKAQVGEAFDVVIELESKKIKPSDGRVSQLLNQ